MIGNCYIGTISILRQQKDWEDGFGKWQVLLTVNIVFIELFIPFLDYNFDSKLQKYQNIKQWRPGIGLGVTQRQPVFKPIT